MLVKGAIDKIPTAVSKFCLVSWKGLELPLEYLQIELVGV